MSSNSWAHNFDARWRRARASRRPSDEELAHALMMWSLMELMSIDGSIGSLAKAEVKKLGIDVPENANENETGRARIL